MNRPLLVLAALLATAAAGGEPPWADRAAWEQVDVVPMPKRIRLTGRRLPLSSAIIVLGEEPSEQDRIGAEWINAHIVKRGGRALPILRDGDARLRIVVGTRATCAIIDEAARTGLLKLDKGVPGWRGYVVQPRTKGASTDLLLGGADRVGALYACVTLAGLLDGEKDDLVLREAEIVDWPDFPTVTHGINLAYPELGALGRRLRRAERITQEQEREYLRTMQEHLDRLLARKISCYKANKYVFGARYWRDTSPAFAALYRKVTAYAKARGIRSLVYALTPFCGLAKDFPDAPKRCLTGIGREKYHRYLRCWSLDDERRQNAARLGKFLASTGITDIGFHDSDTGGFLSPARWAERCDVCRKRWGGDFAAATINKHRIYCDEIKKGAPDCRIHFTLYPYNISVLTQEGAERYHVARYGPSSSVPEVARQLRERFTDFWARVTKGLPDGVTFCIRENFPENVRRFQDLTKPHGTFAWYKVGSEQWRTFFDESPRWAPTFYSGGDDLMFTVSLESFVPLKALAVREYAWNVRAPGAMGWALLPQADRERHAEPQGEIYEIVMPHVVRNFFGRRAAPDIVEALSANMAMNQIFDHLPSRKRKIDVLTTYARWQWQADEAAKGCEALDRLFSRFVASGDRLGMTRFAARRFVYLREVFHCCKWMAQAKAANQHARELAKEGQLDEARQEIERGRKVVANAKADLARLLAERPDDPVYNIRFHRGKRPFHWKIYTPDNGVDFGVPEQLLAQTEQALPSLAAAGEIPPRMLETLAKRRTVHVAPAAGRPRIDGRLDEAQWRRARPVEALFVYPGRRGIARAHTRARFLRDDSALYFGVTCWMPDGALVKAQEREWDGPVHEDEAVELFLMPPHLKGGYVQFQINADGSVADKRVTVTLNELKVKVAKRDRTWNAQQITVETTRQNGVWELEAAVPRSSLGAADWRGTWRVNVCRDFKGPVGARELSSILPPSARNFHDTSAFPRLILHPQPAGEPYAEISVMGFRHQTRTLDDRVATVCEFGLQCRANCVLHDVRITAETYDRSGRLHLRQVVKRLDHLTFAWQSDRDLAVGFEQQIEAGGVKLVLESDEVRVERWIRIAGWEGTREVGSVFAPGVAGQGLRGLCHLPAQIMTPGSGRPTRLVPQRRGAIECWFKHDWRVPHPLADATPWMPRFVLLHSGVLRREHPEHFNHSSLTLYHGLGSGTMYLSARNRSYAGWHTHGQCEAAKGWLKPGWHHVACVWDYGAAPADQLRLYIDGVRSSAKALVSKPERLRDQAIALAPTPFATQLGSLNTGRHLAPVVLDEFRISRSARYVSDFAPQRHRHELDMNTSALFHFDRNLDGEGMTETGERYPVRGQAGALALH